MTSWKVICADIHVRAKKILRRIDDYRYALKRDNLQRNRLYAVVVNSHFDEHGHKDRQYFFVKQRVRTLFGYAWKNINLID